MKLLIVDDEIVTTQVLEEKIDRKYLGLEEIYTAYDVDMAKEILKEEQVDIILCDIEMPRANGLELLEWVRESQAEAEFLFLTCHEKFEYAFGAVKYGAASYLLKPIDIAEINRAIFAVAEKIRRKKEISDIEGYWNKGKKKIIRDFWRNALQNGLSSKKEEIQKEIYQMGLDFNMRERYILVLFHVRKEALFNRETPETLGWFILSNIFAELLTSSLQVENVVSWEDGGELYVTVVSDKDCESLQGSIAELKSVLERYYNNPIYVGYISEQSEISDLGAVRNEILNYDRTHVYDNGEIFLFSELGRGDGKLEKPLDQKLILQCLEKGERVKLLEYLQKTMSSARKKNYSLTNMQYLQMELLRIVGVFLNRYGTDLELFYADPVYITIQKKALASEFDMMRWNTYVINKVFDSVEERKRGVGITDVMIDYIRNHYEENITRNSLAKLVHFSPEYVGKILKKEMGVSINDYINTLRISRAKSMITSTNYKIIDIALMVGYDNMSYFSSVFKKYEGVSPAEYKRISEHRK